MEQTGKINYTFLVFKFDAKVLTLKLYYELKMPEPALSLIDSFSHFLSKKKCGTAYVDKSSSAPRTI